MCSDVVVGLELISPDAVKLWRATIGPTNTLVAKKDAPYSVRGLYGTDGTKNAVHGADSTGSFKRES